MRNWLYWIWYIPGATVRFTFHAVLAGLYCGRGKRVPRIQNHILLKSAKQIAEDIREGRLKSEDVVKAYTERILEVEPYINATVDRCFQNALNEAKEVDILVNSGIFTKEQLATEKPLLGVPFSVKVLLTVKGLRCTAGSNLFENVKAFEDAPSVALMKKAGAIVISTTNSAEFGMHFETNNKIHGKTCNPYNTNRTSGGSSGGESALIASGGSILGLGNDLLGSVRVPSHFTGIFAHKPTVGLVPNTGCHPPPHPKMQHFLYTGPMCRYAEDLTLSMRILASESGMPMKFGQAVDFKKVKIFYIRELFTPLIRGMDKDISRAIERAVLHFRDKYGCTTEEVELHKMHDVNRCVMHHLLHPLDGEVKTTLTLGKGMNINEKLDLLKSIVGKSKLSQGPLVVINGAKLPGIYSKNNQRHYENMLQEWMEELNCLLDEDSVLMMPTAPFTAPYHNETLALLPSYCYTSIFNVTGLPSTQCPLGINNQRLPYGMQIVGRKNNDPLTIACAVELENIFGGWRDPGSI